MKAIIVMFDSLNRHLLSPYGCAWTHTPNFQRLAQRTVQFNQSYVCSMPCMPARREMHTARPNLLHRSWGPLEPFDDSVPEMLKKAGVHTHMVTDHYHYFEDGGATYHPRYSTWEFFRGQEGDAWKGQVAAPNIPPHVERKGTAHLRPGDLFYQDMINRQFMGCEELQPQPQTFAAGLDYIRRNASADNWCVHIETFDPHEPFFTQRKYKDIFARHYEAYRKAGGRHFDWPEYDYVRQSSLEVEHMRTEYAALLAMCDVYMGEVLDTMDQLKLWDDTMLIVCTDHGFLLSEHECWAKCWMPFYEEVAHTPFFVWDPRIGQDGQSREALVQPSLDVPVTLLDFFGVERTPDMLGKVLTPVLKNDTPVRDAAMFGMHGGQLNVTDGRYVYMRAAVRDDNQPIFDYTLMPTHMRWPFSPQKLKNASLAKPFSFTKGCPVLKIPGGRAWDTDRNSGIRRTMLFDLQNDPRQERPLTNPCVERQMMEHLVRLMKECDAPSEQFQRLGLESVP